MPEHIKTDISLDRTPDDWPEYDPRYQEELKAFASSLDIISVEHSQHSIALHTVNAGGWPVGYFELSFVPSAITGLAAVAGAWVQARYGRKVRLKVGDVEVEARTIAEIEQLLERAASFQDRDANGDKES